VTHRFFHSHRTVDFWIAEPDCSYG
jgi:hypothetical protein